MDEESLEARCATNTVMSTIPGEVVTEGCTRTSMTKDKKNLGKKEYHCMEGVWRFTFYQGFELLCALAQLVSGLGTISNKIVPIL